MQIDIKGALMRGVQGIARWAALPALLLTAPAAVTAHAAIQPVQHGDATWQVAGAAVMNLLASHDTPAQCEATLAALRDQAMDGNGGQAFAQLVLGGVYLSGLHCGDFVIRRDPQQAALFLSNAAVDGSTFAMAAMAELELQQGHALSANVWAQLYVHYGALKESPMRQGYAASLLHRALPLLASGQKETLLSDVKAFLANYNAAIERGMQRARHAAAKVPVACRIIPVDPHALHQLLRPMRDLPRAGLALYLVGVDARGEVQAVAPILSLPTARTQRRLRNVAENWRAQPAPQCDSALRYGLLPSLYDDQRYALQDKD